MKRIVIGIIVAAFITVGLCAPTFAATLVNCSGSTDGVCASTGDDAGKMIKSIVILLIYLIGAVAVFMMVYGGFRYVTSGGDEKSVAAAKNTILYAAIGIIVALLGYAIVNFVVSSVGTGSGSSGASPPAPKGGAAPV